MITLPSVPSSVFGNSRIVNSDSRMCVPFSGSQALFTGVLLVDPGGVGGSVSRSSVGVFGRIGGANADDGSREHQIAPVVQLEDAGHLERVELELPDCRGVSFSAAVELDRHVELPSFEIESGARSGAQ